MPIKHTMTLSTTEPNNNVGVIKVRQEDTNSQIFDVEVEANGEPVNFTGLTPFFINKTKIADGKPVEQADRMKIYPKEGCLEYTLNNRDWQWIGKNTAYISFRKLNNDDTWSEMYSTRDFTYQVTEGITQGTVYDSGYVWTFEDLLRMFANFVNDSENTMLSLQDQWDKFIQDNKEILESIDPGGKLLNQLNEMKKKQEELDGTVTINAELQIGGETPRPAFEQALKTLRSKIDKTKFNVLHMTDLHTDYGYGATSWKYAQYFFSHITNMQSLEDVADVAIHNGDNADCYIKDKEQSEIQQRKFGIKALRKAKIPTFVNIGNHDNGSPPFKRDIGKVMPGDIITNEEFKDFYGARSKLFDEVRNGDSLYFYKDFPEKKVRVIGLNTNDNNQTVFSADGTYKYGSHDHFAMQQEQLKWLADVALKVPTDYHVIVFGHCPLQETIFDNRECLIKILEAFKLGTSVPIKSVYPDHLVNFTANFTKQGPATLIGYICGHWHDEGFNQIGNSIKFTQMRCLNGGFSDPTLIDTPQEDCWSVLSVDTVGKKVNVYGFGRATDRSFTY
ncbi:hypothetical protein BCR22_07420 [Enterococcus plantarum]|uniref:BppU family phage baseplate upper protein n=1 Tax=Enterococcus plantarum TaxID=1077675 RepID=UPI00084DC4C8|nr:BppU family phage baseplate upper protein [Enterococcus plantarum]OEG09416.1 hypothetical protein BCR22_07420 [Enterococcus plantarum]